MVRCFALVGSGTIFCVDHRLKNCWIWYDILFWVELKNCGIWYDVLLFVKKVFGVLICLFCGVWGLRERVVFVFDW